jgi:hypothetical protein
MKRFELKDFTDASAAFQTKFGADIKPSVYWVSPEQFEACKGSATRIRVNGYPVGSAAYLSEHAIRVFGEGESKLWTRKEDGFNVQGTTTGRMQSKDPNESNTPQHRLPRKETSSMKVFTGKDFKAAYAAFQKSYGSHLKPGMFSVSESQFGECGGSATRMQGCRLRSRSILTDDQIKVSDLGRSTTWTRPKEEEKEFQPFMYYECEQAVTKFRRAYPKQRPGYIVVTREQYDDYRDWCEKNPSKSFGRDLGLESSDDIRWRKRYVTNNTMQVHGARASYITWTRGEKDTPKASPEMELFGENDFELAHTAFCKKYGKEATPAVFWVSKEQYDAWEGSILCGCSINYCKGTDSNHMEVTGGNYSYSWVRPEDPSDIVPFTAADFHRAYDCFQNEFQMRPSEFWVSAKHRALRQGPTFRGCPVLLHEVLATPIIKVVGEKYVIYWQRDAVKPEEPKEAQEKNDPEEPKKPKTRLEVSARAHFRSQNGKDYIIPPPKGKGWEMTHKQEVYPPLYVTDSRINTDDSVVFMVSRVAYSSTPPLVTLAAELICVRDPGGIIEAMEWRKQAVAEKFQCVSIDTWERKVPIVEEALPERYHDRLPLAPEPPPSGIWLGGHSLGPVRRTKKGD